MLHTAPHIMGWQHGLDSPMYCSYTGSSSAPAGRRWLTEYSVLLNRRGFMRACRSRDVLCRLGRLAGFARAITWKLPLHGLKSHTGKIITTNVASLMRRHLAKVAVAAELLQNLTRRLTPSNPRTKQQHTHSKEQTEAKSHTSYQLEQRKPKSHASCSCTKITNQNRMPAPAALRKH